MHLPEPYIHISAIAGAANDRTFVLAAHTTGQFALKGATAFFLAQFDPADLKVSVMPLLIPTEVGDQFDGLALSADGTQLALAITTGGPSAAKTDDEIMIYSLPKGTVKVWTGRGAAAFGDAGYGDPQAISWSRTGELAFNWATGSASSNAVWVLNTTTAGGSLLGNSKFVVRMQNDAGWTFNGDGILTLDGTRIIAPTYRIFGTNYQENIDYTAKGYPPKPRAEGSPAPHPPNTSSEFEEFSVATGQPVAVVYRRTNVAENLYWTDPSRGVLVVGLLKEGRHPAGEVGAIVGGEFASLPAAPSWLFDKGSVVF